MARVAGGGGRATTEYQRQTARFRALATATSSDRALRAKAATAGPARFDPNVRLDASQIIDRRVNVHPQSNPRPTPGSPPPPLGMKENRMAPDPNVARSMPRPRPKSSAKGRPKLANGKMPKPGKRGSPAARNGRMVLPKLTPGKANADSNRAGLTKTAAQIAARKAAAGRKAVSSSPVGKGSPAAGHRDSGRGKGPRGGIPVGEVPRRFTPGRPGATPPPHRGGAIPIGRPPKAGPPGRVGIGKPPVFGGGGQVPGNHRPGGIPIGPPPLGRPGEVGIGKPPVQGGHGSVSIGIHVATQRPALKDSTTVSKGPRRVASPGYRS